MRSRLLSRKAVKPLKRPKNKADLRSRVPSRKAVTPLKKPKNKVDFP